jgi:hypothetical protein
MYFSSYLFMLLKNIVYCYLFTFYILEELFYMIPQIQYENLDTVDIGKYTMI